MNIQHYLTFCCLSVAGIFSGNACFGQTATPPPNPEPHILIYKTKKDYSKYVPVQLSADRKTIVSYPDPSDLAGVDLQPVKLKGSYWLDRSGIGPNVAFLRLSYKQYAALKAAPSEAELNNMILDANPLKELCDCGAKSEYKQVKQELNKIIISGKIRKRCKTLR